MSIWPCIDGIEVAVTTATMCRKRNQRASVDRATCLLYGITNIRF